MLGSSNADRNYIYRFGSAEFDASRAELRVNGALVPLEHKPLLVLAELLARPGVLLTRQELRDSVWDGRATVEQTLTNAIRKLRIALGDQDGQCIVTVPRLGYKLEGSVQRTAITIGPKEGPALVEGAAVPARDGWTLERQLASDRNIEVWRTVSVGQTERRVVKFGFSPAALMELKRQARAYENLGQQLGQRNDMIQLVSVNFGSHPCFLELTDGGTQLQDWNLSGAPLAGEIRAERLALWLQVANAVAAAHSAGVPHLKLKPANIFVSGPAERPVVQVADFAGSGPSDPMRRATVDATSWAAVGSDSSAEEPKPGDAPYMAPERLLGQPGDSRSDVFALGLLLYQTLVGDFRKLLTPGWEREIGDPILIEDIAAATDADPAQRPSAAGEFAARVRALTARTRARIDQQEACRRLELAELSAQRARMRRPWLVGLVASLAAGFMVSSFLAYRTAMAEREVSRQLDRAERTSSFLSEVVLGAADYVGPHAIQSTEMRGLIDWSAAQVSGRFANDPGTQASVETALADAYYHMSDFAHAEQQAQNAVALQSAQYGRGDARTLRTQYLRVHILTMMGRDKEAATILEEADELAGTRRSEISELAYDAHRARASFEMRIGEPAQALPALQRAAEISNHLSPEILNRKTTIRVMLSRCLMQMGRIKEAAHVQAEIVGPDYSPERIGMSVWASAHIEYGALLNILKRHQESAQVLEAALQVFEPALGEDHFDVGWAENELGRAMVHLGRWQEAEEHLKLAYQVALRTTGADGQEAWLTRALLGVVKFRTGYAREGLSMLADAHAGLTRTFGSLDPQTQAVGFDLASLLVESRHYAEAQPIAEQLKPELLAQDTLAEEKWPVRLDAMRGAIRIGLGETEAGRAQLSAALAELDPAIVPQAELAALKRCLEAQ